MKGEAVEDILINANNGFLIDGKVGLFEVVKGLLCLCLMSWLGCVDVLVVQICGIGVKMVVLIG
jgi:hypothetical protein